jgi:hypothetical protein
VHRTSDDPRLGIPIIQYNCNRKSWNQFLQKIDPTKIDINA